MLALLIILNILLRLPFTPHPHGVDSYLVHWMAESIKKESRPSWLLHPSSLFGLYPYSHPAFVPYLLASTSSITGLEIEATILIYCILFSIIGCLSTYILARKATGRFTPSFLAAAAFSISPAYYRFTYWTISTRGLFITLLPFLLYSLVQSREKQGRKYFAMTGILLFLEFSAHQMYFLIFLFILPAFGFSIVYFRYRQTPAVRLALKYVPAALTVIFIILFTIQFSEIGFFKRTLALYRDGFLFSAGVPDSANDINKSIAGINMFIDYTSRTGFAFLFFPIGLYHCLYRMNRGKIDFPMFFLLASFISGSFFLTRGVYSSIFFLSTISIISVTGFIELASYFRIEKWIETLTAVLLIASVFSTFFMIYHWNIRTSSNSESPWVKESEYRLSRYSKTVSGTLMANTQTSRYRLSALTYRPIFPYMDILGPDILTYKIDPEVHSYPFTRIKSISPDTDNFWKVESKLNPFYDWGRLWKSSIDSERAYTTFDRYNIEYVIEQRSERKDDRILKNELDKADKVYENDYARIYDIPI